MSDLVGNPEDRFSRVAAHVLNARFMSFKEKPHDLNMYLKTITVK